MVLTTASSVVFFVSFVNLSDWSPVRRRTRMSTVENTDVCTNIVECMPNPGNVACGVSTSDQDDIKMLIP